MAISMDELLTVLPEADMAIAHLCEHRCGTWTAILTGREKPEEEWHGQGPTAALAICGALVGAGFQIEDT